MTRRNERGISTVVDVSVFLLLVGAAVFSVATAADASADDTVSITADRDEATVETLATTTATVQYDLGVDDRTGEPIERARHGTLAELLADAAVANATVDGAPLSPYAVGFVDAVEATVSPLLDGRTQVAATWRPIPGSTLAGQVRLGPDPPTDSTVHAATLTVDSGIPPTSDRARSASVGGYGHVADVVARGTVDGLFPPRRTRVALDGDGADAVVAREQFASMRSAYDSETTFEAGVEPARADLTAAVSNRTTRTLASQFETPRAAAAAVRTGSVHIVVRTWS
jgi:hypothetical protein